MNRKAENVERQSGEQRVVERMIAKTCFPVVFIPITGYV